jgi:tight adherence protein C
LRSDTSRTNAMLPIIAIFVFVAVAVAVFALASAAYTPSSMLGERLKSLGVQPDQPRQKSNFRERMENVLDPLGRALQLSPGDRSRIWLIQAGFRERQHLVIYQGSRVVGAAALFLLALAVTGFQSVALLAGFAALGLFMPRFVLKRLIRNRQREITVGLPDALDLTVVCVEAGLALDNALMRVGEDLKYAHPALSEEFYISNLEMRAGKPRAEALRSLAARTGVDDVRALVSALVQTDRFGTSIAQALRLYSDALRTERRRRAEEAAAKTSTKMIIPLVVFALLPLIFVTLGPALIELLHELSPAVRK